MSPSTLERRVCSTLRLQRAAPAEDTERNGFSPPPSSPSSNVFSKHRKQPGEVDCLIFSLDTFRINAKHNHRDGPSRRPLKKTTAEYCHRNRLRIAEQRPPGRSSRFVDKHGIRIGVFIFGMTLNDEIEPVLRYLCLARIGTGLERRNSRCSPRQAAFERSSRCQRKDVMVYGILEQRIFDFLFFFFFWKS